MKVEKAIKLMNLVRIAAVVLILASAVLYFTAEEYALYPALLGFAIMLFINMPIHIWLAVNKEKGRKEQLKQFEAERKENKENRNDKQ